MDNSVFRVYGLGLKVNYVEIEAYLIRVAKYQIKQKWKIKRKIGVGKYSPVLELQLNMHACFPCTSLGFAVKCPKFRVESLMDSA